MDQDEQSDKLKPEESEYQQMINIESKIDLNLTCENSNITPLTGLFCYIYFGGIIAAVRSISHPRNRA